MQHNHANTTIDPESPQVHMGSEGTWLTVAAFVLSAAGLAMACWLGLRGPESRALFFHAYLVAFVFYLSITLGGLFFVMLHHLARAGWSVTLRRLAEALAGNMGLMTLMAAPILVGMGDLYEWSHAEAVEHDALLAAKAGWLNPTAFTIRLAAYFALWGGLAWYFRSRSIRQDATGDPGPSMSMGRLSTIGMLALAVSSTMAAFDLLMSLNPHWYSTIFGVYFFANSILAGLIVLTLLALWLRASGRLVEAVNVEHYHDLGKLTFAFTFFWGYIAFSQYMLIWYANLPEETQFYIPRQLGPWAGVSLALVACHLVLPFVGLLSRHAKRNLLALTFWSVWLLAALVLDLFWLVMPSMFIREIPHAVGAAPGTPLPEALAALVASNQQITVLAERHADFARQIAAPLEPASLMVLAGLLLGLGGMYVVNTVRLLRGVALAPVKDPRLDESLAFENA